MSELAERLLAKDTTLWPPGSEAATRLGWLDSPALLAGQAHELMAWAATLDVERVVLLGMGGSSLGPEVLRAAHRSHKLVVLDTTDPKTIADVPIEGSAFLVASKSGSTLEPKALAAHFWSKVPDGSRWFAITDPGTQAEQEAKDKGYARIFVNDPNIGGRYSVLSHFGMVPAAIIGLDVGELCRRALASDWLEGGAHLGVLMAEAAGQGRDKLTVHIPHGPFSAFGMWVEQLVAESLGKRGTGIIPVPTADVEMGRDREIVAVHIGDVLDLGAEMLRWEVATAIAGSLLGIDAFDQPDVESAKIQTRARLDHLPVDLSTPVGVDPVGAGALGVWLAAHTKPGDHVVLQAYLPFGQDAALERLRCAVRDRLGGMAVTVGYGPRFLHSTGQLHKGGPPSTVAVQIVPAAPTADVEVPGFGYDFGTLIAAQWQGDAEALLHAKRRVARVTLKEPSVTRLLEGLS